MQHEMQHEKPEGLPSGFSYFDYSPSISLSIRSVVHRCVFCPQRNMNTEMIARCLAVPVPALFVEPELADMERSAVLRNGADCVLREAVRCMCVYFESKLNSTVVS